MSRHLRSCDISSLVWALGAACTDGAASATRESPSTIVLTVVIIVGLHVRFTWSQPWAQARVLRNFRDTNARARACDAAAVPAHCDQIIARDGTPPRSCASARSDDATRSVTVKTHPPGF